MSSNNRPPLAGITVLDLTRLLPGPLASLHLADLGATVIKIEDLGAGDYARELGAPVGHNAGLFLLLNRNKQSIRLNLKHPQGVALFLQLAAQADVILESFRPGVVEKLGINYATVRAHNPKIVYAAITGYGQNGPWCERAGHDMNFCAVTGVLGQSGGQGLPPQLGNFQIGDIVGGALSAVMGVLAALFDAARTGQGRYVDVAMADCTAAHAILPLAHYLAHGHSASRGEDFLTGALACYHIYATADAGYLAVAALEEKFWQRFCHTLGEPAWCAWHGLVEQAPVIAAVQARLQQAPLAYWTALFAEVDCCVTPVLTLEEALHHPQLRARELFVSVKQPHDGTITAAAFPVKLSDYQFTVSRPAPQAGEHTEAYLRAQGYSASELAAWQADGVIA